MASLEKDTAALLESLIQEGRQLLTMKELKDQLGDVAFKAPSDFTGRYVSGPHKGRQYLGRTYRAYRSNGLPVQDRKSPKDWKYEKVMKMKDTVVVMEDGRIVDFW